MPSSSQPAPISPAAPPTATQPRQTARPAPSANPGTRKTPPHRARPPWACAWADRAKPTVADLPAIGRSTARRRRGGRKARRPEVGGVWTKLQRCAPAVDEPGVTGLVHLVAHTRDGFESRRGARLRGLAVGTPAQRVSGCGGVGADARSLAWGWCQARATRWHGCAGCCIITADSSARGGMSGRPRRCTRGRSPGGPRGTSCSTPCGGGSWTTRSSGPGPRCATRSVRRRSRGVARSRSPSTSGWPRPRCTPTLRPTRAAARLLADRPRCSVRGHRWRSASPLSPRRAPLPCAGIRAECEGRGAACGQPSSRSHTRWVRPGRPTLPTRAGFRPAPFACSAPAPVRRIYEPPAAASRTRAFGGGPFPRRSNFRNAEVERLSRRLRGRNRPKAEVRGPWAVRGGLVAG